MKCAEKMATSRTRMLKQNMGEVRSGNREFIQSQRRNLTEDQREQVRRVERERIES